MDRLTSMAVFVRSVEMGSMTAAARHFRLSQAMISKHIRGLEESLGARLLEVTTRKLTTTEAGRRFFERCRHILGEVDEAALEASRFQASPRGLLRVTAPAAFGRLHLAPAIARFMQRCPDLAVEAEFADQFVNLVQEGVDVAVRIGRLPDSTLIVHRLGTCQMLTCASAAYLDRAGTPGHPSELARHACLCLNTIATPGVWQYRTDGSHDIDVRVSGPLRSNDIDLLCTAAELGVGIVYGPSFVLGHRVQAGRLRPILGDYPGRPLDLNAIFPSNRHLSSKVRVFVDFLDKWFDGTPPWDVAPASPQRTRTPRRRL